ncbi:MAG: hypothetical protein PHU98_06405 [Mariniphaga sp.]|jgi:predicted translin family RNA/ssDNA-binding protein|nr:hypothetical protein [Paludibacter sp.]MDD4226003.1 hypothetical protein [Mariniphaga sp.]
MALKILSLRIKEENLLKIASGEKKEELRTVNDFYYSRFVKQGGKEYQHYDILYLYVGNNRDAKYLKVKILNIYAFEYLVKIPKGMKKGDKCFCIELGEVLEKNF